MLHIFVNLMKRESMARDLAPELLASATNAGQADIPLLRVLELAEGRHDVLGSGAWPFRCAAEPDEATALAQSLAFDCAGRVVAAFSGRYPGDLRIERCSITTERFLRGEATVEELLAAEAEAFQAAREAAMKSYPAACDSAWAAASAVMDAAYAARSSGETVSWALWAVAEAAVIVGGPQERLWQTARLGELVEQAQVVPKGVAIS